MSELSPAMAAGGPLNAVSVSGGNLTWVVIVAVIALAALAVAGWLVREVLAASQGTAKMQEIGKAVQEGAAAYLRRQFRTQNTLWILSPALFFYNSLCAAFSRKIAWRGIAYELVSPTQTIVINENTTNK